MIAHKRKKLHDNEKKFLMEQLENATEASESTIEMVKKAHRKFRTIHRQNIYDLTNFAVISRIYHPRHCKYVRRYLVVLKGASLKIHRMCYQRTSRKKSCYIEYMEHHQMFAALLQQKFLEDIE